MHQLSIEYRDTLSLQPRVGNARTHSKPQIFSLCRSIDRYGWTTPILIDENGIIIAGHGRWQAAVMMGISRVPTVTIRGLTPAELRAYVIADNRIALDAGWDADLLAAELKEIEALDIDFDLTLTGFTPTQIDLLIDPPAAKVDPLDHLPDLVEKPVTRDGDLWTIARHRLLCSSALTPAAYETLLDGEKAQYGFTDPPYNVPIQGHVSGLGRHRHREFAMASGEMSDFQFKRFLEKALGLMAEHSVNGAVHVVAMDWRHFALLMAVAEQVYGTTLNVCIWDKGTGGMGSLYRSQYEMFAIFKNGTAPHINNVELGKNGRYRTNVWAYPGQNSFGAGRDEALASHPTAKPVALIADAIRDCTKRGGLVLDAFAGSGSTLVAAHKTKRRGAGIEIDPIYCDRILARLEKATKSEARLVATGETFAAVAARRANEAPPASTGTNIVPFTGKPSVSEEASDDL